MQWEVPQREKEDSPKFYEGQEEVRRMEKGETVKISLGKGEG